MLNDFELYNVHTECAEIEKWSILFIKMSYIEHNRKALGADRVEFNLTEGNCVKGYRQIKGENRSCREVDFGNMSAELQIHYLDMYQGVQAETNNVSQLHKLSDVSTTYLGYLKMPIEDAFNTQQLFSFTDQSTTKGRLLDGTNCRISPDNGATKILILIQ